MNEKFWKFEKVAELPKKRSESYAKYIIEDFLKTGLAIGKVQGAPIYSVCPLRKFIEDNALPLKVAVRKKEVYIYKSPRV